MHFPILQEVFGSSSVFSPHPKAAALIAGVGSVPRAPEHLQK